MLSATLVTKDYAHAQVKIDASPKQVWAVLIDPVRFKDNHVKEVKIISNSPTHQVIQYTIAAPFRDFSFTTESELKCPNYISFKRISGDFKEISGNWKLTELGKNATLLEYSVYVDTGLPIPIWLIRQLQQIELPSVLERLKGRVDNETKD